VGGRGKNEVEDPDVGVEIERKFLLRDASWRDACVRSVRMCQGYLGGERCSVRVRIAGERAQLNVKSRTAGAQRLEFEYELPLADAKAMLAAFCRERIEKTRHYVEHAGMLWEVDEFEGANLGLVVAEIELEREAQQFAMPPWIAEEVTHDLRYYNNQLARVPYSSWRTQARGSVE
jgi:adenylate cyclase